MEHAVPISEWLICVFEDRPDQKGESIAVGGASLPGDRRPLHAKAPLDPAVLDMRGTKRPRKPSHRRPSSSPAKPHQRQPKTSPRRRPRRWVLAVIALCAWQSPPEASLIRRKSFPESSRNSRFLAADQRLN